MYSSFLDPRFPIDHKVTINFENNHSTNDNRSLMIQSPLIRIETATNLAHWDSLANLKEGKMNFYLRFN